MSQDEEMSDAELSARMAATSDDSANPAAMGSEKGE